MRMTINKPRQHKPPGRLNHDPRFHPVQPPNSDNPPPINPHIPPKPRRPNPIDNPPTTHNHIKTHPPIESLDLHPSTAPRGPDQVRSHLCFP
ncbi:hypothetical protein Acor_84740 [Acrocarpospora corrugata]|uniref:Uncharacterized protein n=1 Tax=Acrocarpospora corrugata TaxID=35763 RepID=A0A5M3WBI9_9ACTN|nr:hypothetical protein Acor_84740 [Acrocarpospora corrugata]